MRIDGFWLLCDDGIVRPVLDGTGKQADGTPLPVRFLIDSGADCTVFSAEIYAKLGLTSLADGTNLAGVGGRVESAVVEARVRFLDTQGNGIQFAGNFAAILDPEALDMSVLGRDILNMFAVILDRQRETIHLLGQGSGYTLVES
jgi:predicted aspartyl protease